MKKIGPGYNDPGFTIDVTCEGDVDWRGEAKGCGSRLSVDRNDLFTVYIHDIGGKRFEVRCKCLICNQELNVPLRMEFFKEPLPDRAQWLAKKAAKKYQVLDNGKPADHSSYPRIHPSWNCSKFDSYDEALAYVSRWLGNIDIEAVRNFPLELNKPYDFNGHGDTIEIREVES